MNDPDPATGAIPPGTTHAAVCIGVDRTGTLQPLDGAVEGARKVADWLAGAKYHVIRHFDVDDGGTVSAVARADIEESVRSLVDLGTLQQLVVYFAGHGYLNGQSEIWLLSGAPDSSSEAINLGESAEFARASGVPNVIFIADTCRSTPQTLRANNIFGASIFPNRDPSQTVDPEIDRFFATRPGDVALEVALDEARADYKGLFTEVLKLMFDDPEEGDVTTLGTVTTISNRTLKELLPVRFADYAGRISARIRQQPMLRLECGDDTYLAPVGRIPTRITRRGGGAAFAQAEAAAPAPSLASKVTDWLTDTGPRIAMRGGGAASEPDELLSAQADARAQLAAEPKAHFETQCGVAVAGTTIADFAAIGPIALSLQSPETLRVQNAPDDWNVGKRPGSIVVRFADGSGTILAALPGYIASLVVENGGVTTVSYRPAPGSNAANESGTDSTRDTWIDELRARVAAAVRHGVLDFDRKGMDFAEMIRVGKRADPSLGLYSGLIYAEAGNRAKTRSVRDCMRRDQNIDLYDIWLLAGADAYASRSIPRVPICPMLSQSWDYVRPRGVSLPPLLVEAERRQALWTTFTPKAMETIIAAAKGGALNG